MPPADLVIDSELNDPETAARRIAGALDLPSATAATCTATGLVCLWSLTPAARTY
jgi:hypothetical protein